MYPSLLSLSPAHPSTPGSSQSLELGSLSRTASHWPSVLPTTVGNANLPVCQCRPLNSPHPLLPLLRPQVPGEFTSQWSETSANNKHNNEYTTKTNKRFWMAWGDGEAGKKDWSLGSGGQISLLNMVVKVGLIEMVISEQKAKKLREFDRRKKADKRSRPWGLRRMCI